jgi:translation initiation factor IF-2
VRIYALAKELKLDSKDLVDLCAKAGITGKGSALASLTDEEVAKLRAFLSGGPAAGGPRPAARVEARAGDAGRPGAPKPLTGTLRREDYVAPSATLGGRPKVLELKSRIDREKPEKVEPAPPPVEEQPQAPVEETPVETVATATPPAPPVEPEERPATGRPQRPGRLAPAGKPPVLAKKKSADDEGPRPAKPTGTGPRLGRMPVAPKSAKSSAPTEPTPQKPDIKLPADAIRASKAGLKPLSEHLRKHEEKRTTDAARLKGKVGHEDEATTKARGRRGAKGEAVLEPESPDQSLLGGRMARQLQRKRSEAADRRRGQEDDGSPAARRLTRIKRGAKAAPQRKGRVTLQLPCTVRSFCETVGVPVAHVQKVFMNQGLMLTINSPLDPEQTELLAIELGVDIDIKHEVTLEDQVLAEFEQPETEPEKLQPRPPIVTFLGHVDHGKTSLLDKIIGIDVASGESGGITQHIRAYQIERDGRRISFVDTPGHEAFTEMRARGANVTDIAVLVVAGDDGVMPQTEEAISHARAANVPIVVALNKTDLPGVNVDRIYQQLSSNGIVPAEWDPEGVEVVKTSAVTGLGIAELLETLWVTADLNEYSANPDRPAVGTCLEAQQEAGRGVVAKIIVQQGTLRVGDVVVCGAASGRVQAMYDTLDLNRHLNSAGPSTPVNVTGFDAVPAAGDRFYVLDDIVKAREIATSRSDRSRQSVLAGGAAHVTLENLFDRLQARETVQSLNLILRADVRGSIEAIQKELSKLKHEEVQVRVLQALVGGITEADVHLAHASDAIIIGFNVVADEAARILAERFKVDIRRYDIIYQLSDDLKKALEGKLKPEEREVELGRALVQQAFVISRTGTIAGCRVISGKIERNSRARVIRESRIIGDYQLESLRREKDDAREVREGLECGIKLAGFNDIKPGDILEDYRVEEVARTLD